MTRAGGRPWVSMADLPLARAVIFPGAEGQNDMKRAAEPLHNFAARCPNGHRPPQSLTLSALRDPQVRFHCRVCEESWTPDDYEHDRALGFAEASEGQFETPLNAA
jgi:hypothetical protein